MTSWHELLASQRAKPHRTSLQEINDLRALIARDLADCRVPGLSADRRFATAYNAALQVSKMCLACHGYRISGQGHHATTLEAVGLLFGSSLEDVVNYFDACRRKRNQVDYDAADLISESEADDIAARVEAYLAIAEDWISLNHRGLCP